MLFLRNVKSIASVLSARCKGAKLVLVILLRFEKRVQAEMM